MNSLGRAFLCYELREYSYVMAVFKGECTQTRARSAGNTHYTSERAPFYNEIILISDKRIPFQILFKENLERGGWM